MIFARLRKTPTTSAKKFCVELFDDRTGKEKKVCFGARGYEDFTVHKDKVRRSRYLSRHSRREDWKDPFTAGFWATHLLWNKSTIQESMVDISKRFNITFY